MITRSLFGLLFIFGLYFTYYRPKLNAFNKFKNDTDFANYMLIIESNAQFDKKSYEKIVKHLKLFLMYYSESLDADKAPEMFYKMKHQYTKTMKYSNRMLFSIPNSMRRYTYMQYAITNLDSILKKYLEKVAKKSNITFVNI